MGWNEGNRNDQKIFRISCLYKSYVMLDKHMEWAGNWVTFAQLL